MKKKLTYSLIIILLASGLTLFAGTFEIETHRDGTCTINGYSGSESILVIPSVIDGYEVTTIGENAFFENYTLISVIIPESVTSIEHLAFAFCVSLTTITIPKHTINIEGSAFFGCISLLFILVDEENPVFSLNHGVLYNVKEETLHTYPNRKKDRVFSIPNGILGIGDAAFGICESLVKVIIPDSVVSIGDAAFGGNQSLVQITIPDSVLLIGDFAFAWSRSLSSITLPSSLILIGEDIFEDTPIKQIRVVKGSYADTFFKDSRYASKLVYYIP